ncbi:TPA: hypothetical protein MYM36_005285, partial [Klebsiella pneumoniae]|nr:hypothetical protein [Klebsiella pneumoniae]
LIDNLNTLICEDSLLTRQERETLVLAVAAIGAMKARVGLKNVRCQEISASAEAGANLYLTRV